MKKSNDTQVIFRMVFLTTVIVFLLIYARWFWLDPSGVSESDGQLLETYKQGLVLLTIYCFLGSASIFTNKRNCFVYLSAVASIIFFIINVLFATVFMPRLMEYAKYNGIKYYYVSHRPGIDPPWPSYQLIKRKGLFDYEAHEIGNDWAHKGEFMYDKTLNLINIVAVFDDQNFLLYTDDEPPRYYEHSSVQFGNKVLYISTSRPTLNNGNYGSTLFRIYECEIDNTACMPLPFQYIGENDYPFLKYNEQTNEIDLLVSPIHGGDILIYTYGDRPRCYVDGCEILTLP